MAPSLSSVIQHLNLSSHHATDHLHSLVRRHMSADVTTNVIFGVISGVIALIAIVQVAVLAHKNRVLHCRLLHRDESETTTTTGEAQPATSQNAITSESNAPARANATAITSQQARPSTRKTSLRPPTSANHITSTTTKPNLRVINRKLQSSRPAGTDAVLAIAAVLEQALRPLTNSQCMSSPFIFDKASRQS